MTKKKDISSPLDDPRGVDILTEEEKQAEAEAKAEAEPEAES